MPKYFASSQTLSTLVTIQVISLILIVVVGIIASINLAQQPTNGATSSGVTSSAVQTEASEAQGQDDDPCHWNVVVTLGKNDSKKGLVRYPKVAGTSCNDQCVTSGVCTGFDSEDDGPDGSRGKSSFCNATDFSTCNGGCASYADCDLPTILSASDFPPIAYCYSGSCVALTVLYSETATNVVPSVMYPIAQQDSIVTMGPESAACKWQLLTSTKSFRTTKPCLDAYYVSFLTFPITTLCGYQYKCARPNNIGFAAPPSITSLTLPSPAPGNVGQPLNISAPPDVEHFFADVTNASGFNRAALRAGIYRRNTALGIPQPTP
jgi:hypothetical protein